MKTIRELGLLSTDPVQVNGYQVKPRDAFIATVAPKLTRPHGLDLIALRVEVRGVKDGRPAGTRWQLLDRYDERRNVTAMMRTTGYSLAITGIMQLDGRIAKPGVYVPDECVPCAPYVEELAKRGVVIGEMEL